MGVSNIKIGAKVDVGLNESNLDNIVSSFSKLLASNYVLYLKTLYYHWNVKGKDFVSLHDLFKEQYEDLHEFGDEIAERISALGYLAPGTYRDYMELSFIKEDSSLPSSGDEMVKNLLHDNELMIKNLREMLELTSEASDEVSTDAVVGRMEKHEHAAWKLRALIS